MKKPQPIRSSWRSVIFIGLSVLLVSMYYLSNNQRQQELPEVSRIELHPSVIRSLDAMLDQVSQQPDSPKAWGELGILLDLHQQQEAALFSYERAIQLDPGDFRWPYFSGIVASTGEAQKALGYLQQALQIRRHPPLMVRIGLLHLQRGDLSAASEAFQEAVTADDSLIQAHLGMARCSLATADLEAAHRHLATAESKNPVSGEVAAARATYWQRMGDEEKAQESLEASRGRALKEGLPDGVRQEAVLAFGVGPIWREERSRRWIAAGDLGEALAIWQGAIDESPQDADAHLQLARVAELSQDTLMARAAYSQAIRHDPQNAAAHAGLGLLQMRSMELVPAEASLRKALQFDEDSHEIRANLGSLLAATDRDEEGVRLLESARDLRPDDADVRFNLAMTHQKNRRWQQSSAEFEVLLRIDPQRARARFEYGVSLAELGQLPEAIEQFQWLCEKEPKRIASWTNLVRAQVQMKQHGAAIDALKKATEIHPGDRRIAAELAWLLSTCPDQRWRDGPRARQIAEKLITRRDFGYPRALDILAASLAECGEFELAIEKMEEAMQYMSVPPHSEKDPALRDRMNNRLSGYRQQKPHRLEL